MRLLPFVSGLVILLAACSGGGSTALTDTGGSTVLHLRNMDVTADGYRAALQSALVTNPILGSLCKGIKGLSTEDARKALLPDSTPNPQETPPDEYMRNGAIFRAGQQPDTDSSLRAVVIFQEECARIGG